MVMGASKEMRSQKLRVESRKGKQKPFWQGRGRLIENEFELSKERIPQ